MTQFTGTLQPMPSDVQHERTINPNMQPIYKTPGDYGPAQAVVGAIDAGVNRPGCAKIGGAIRAPWVLTGFTKERDKACRTSRQFVIQNVLDRQHNMKMQDSMRLM